jgi:hypothetical protein
MSRGLSARSLSARRPAKAAPEIAQLGRDRGHLRRDARGSGSRVAGAVTQIGNADGLRRTSRTRRVCVSESTTDGRTALSGRAADWRKQVLDSLQAMSLLTIMEIIGPILLFAVLIYGTMQWSGRRRGPTQAVREASTRELYREGARAEKREEAGKAVGGGGSPPVVRISCSHQPRRTRHLRASRPAGASA